MMREREKKRIEKKDRKKVVKHRTKTDIASTMYYMVLKGKKRRKSATQRLIDK